MACRAWVVLAVALATPAFGDDIADLSSRDIGTRRRAVRALEALPVLPPAAIEPLVRCLDDNDEPVSVGASRALAHGGAAARAAVEPLLTSPEHNTRIVASQTVARFVASDPAAAPLVLKAFRDNEGIAESTAGVVGSLGVSALPFLTHIAGDPD